MLSLATIGKVFPLAFLLVNVYVICNLQVVDWLLDFPLVSLPLLSDSI